MKLFEDLNLPLHGLINNAGIIMGTRRENKDGLELTMCANHLGHFLLTNLLLPKLRQSNGRVVVVTSSTYAIASNGIDLDDLNCERRQYTMFSHPSPISSSEIKACYRLVGHQSSLFKELFLQLRITTGISSLYPL